MIEPQRLPGDGPRRDARRSPTDEALVRLPAKLDWLETRAIEAAMRATGGTKRPRRPLLQDQPGDVAPEAEGGDGGEGEGVRSRQRPRGEDAA